MNTEICSAFKWKVPIQWFDRTGYVKLPMMRVAVIELSDAGYKAQFDKFVVTIRSKIHGLIDAHTFTFCDYLVKATDKNTGLYIWPDTRRERLDWYIDQPKDTRPICAAIEQFIKVYQDIDE